MARSVILIAIVFSCIFPIIWANPSYKFENVPEFAVENEDIKYRLPNNTRPEAYAVYLKTDIANDNFNFSGEVEIRVNVLEESNSITLHQRQLEIISAQLFGEDEEEIALSPFTYDAVTEFLTLTTVDHTFSVGDKLFLSIKYKGVLRTDGGGFYRSSYNSNDKQIWLATTQFESTDARHGFPCYDEPALKATFDISITHSPKYTAISNMPLAETKIVDDNYVTSTFEKTPLTSSYLIAFIVSDFLFKEKIGQNGFKHRVYAKQPEIETAVFASNEGEQILRAIGDYLQVNFSLPKMDQAAIPDFNAGAMENWGLVTYRESALLYDPSVHTNQRKVSVVTTISHEFGHQWFGDLVSPAWWSYLWLNEGFATLFEHLGTDLVHPDWNTFQSFLTGKLHSALQTDATERTRPMTYYIEDPRGVQGLFDNIAYAKSGSVLRMFLHALGESTFKKGLKYYLTKQSYQSAIDLDLFEGLDRAAKEDQALPKEFNVKDIFSSWSNQKGAPVLIVTRNYIRNTLEISQERYFNKFPHPEANLTSFWIPYNFDTARNVAINVTRPDGWLPQNTKRMRIKPTKNKKWSRHDWVLFNKQQTGYYRVLYDLLNYKLISRELNEGDINKIHPYSRAQLLDDTKDFVKTGRLPAGILMEMTQYLSREKEYGPWSVAEKYLTEIKRSLNEGSQAYENFKHFVANLVTSLYEEYPMNNFKRDSHVESLIQQLAIKLACEFGVEACISEAKKSFDKFIQTGTFASPNTRGLIYEFGIRNANASVIDSIWNRIQSTTNNEERIEILTSLGSINDKAVLENYLHKSFDPSVALSREERTILYTSVATNSQFGLSKAVELLETKLDEGCTHLVLDKTLLMLANNINSRDLKEQFQSVLGHLGSKKLLTKQRYEDIDEILETTIRSVPMNWNQLEQTLMSLPVNQK